MCARFWRLDHITLFGLLTLRPLDLRLFRLLLAFLARLGLFGLICIRLCLFSEIGGLLGVLLTPLRAFAALALICLLLTTLRALGVRLLGTLFTLAGLRPFTTTLTLICLLLATLGTFTLWLFGPLLALTARTFSSFTLISLRLAALRKFLAVCRNLLLHPNDTGRRRLHRSEIRTGRQGIGWLHQQWQGQNRRRHAGEQSGFHRHEIFLLLAFVPRCSRRPQWSYLLRPTSCGQFFAAPQLYLFQFGSHYGHLQRSTSSGPKSELRLNAVFIRQLRLRHLGASQKS
ncbi:hypothetical protein GCM10010924_06240 [Rhizobium wenxiniae]|nr:hypothetical protein GCM10010924_06240 [Rhizobium wenxiniae]